MNRLIIFDCDGVLVDSENLANLTLVNKLSEFGIHMSMEDSLRQFKGRKVKDCLDEVCKKVGVSLPETFEADYREKLDKVFQAELRVIAGVERVLEMVSWRKCVASNGPLEKTRRSLELTGIDRHFGDKIYSAYMIQKWKPEPDLFLHACFDMGFEPSQCVVVEDSSLGVEAAIRAGMKVVHYVGDPYTCRDVEVIFADGTSSGTHGSTDGLSLNGRYFQLEAMTDLPELLSSLS